jgi:nitrite reductase/ring-hydroxylating ferredoxin subunit
VIAVVIDGRVIARSPVCPHFGGEFAVDVAVDVRSGRCLSNQLKACLREYETVEENGAIAVVYDV